MDSRLLVLVPVTVLIYLLINRSITDQRNADTAKQMNCHPPKILHHRIPWGLDPIYELFRADRNKVLPEYLKERFARAGAGTYSYEFLNRTTIFTIDPENLQAILSSQFQDFSLGTLRRANFLPFLGHGILVRMNELYWLVDGNEFRASCKETHQYVDNLVDVAIVEGLENKANKTKKTFLDSLLEQTSDRVKVRSELINMLLAGRDTTAGLLGWLFHVLVRHPETYLKLRNLILQEFGSYDHPKEITFAKLKDCQYLQYCLNETLRLYPPVPANTRQAIKDTTLPRGGGLDGMGKVFVRKDQQVNYTVYALHRREDFWGSDANEFKPERWIGRKSGWEYLPFNGGPRHCLGQQFALTEVAYVTVRLMQRFDKVENEGPDLVVKHNLSLNSSPYPGVNVAMHAATSC